jgi:hypothetical protein
MPRRHMGEWRYWSTILDLGTRWRWVMIFMLRSLYSRGKRRRYPMNWGWMGLRVGLNAVEYREICYSCLESNPGSPVRRYTDYSPHVNSWKLSNSSFSIRWEKVAMLEISIMQEVLFGKVACMVYLIMWIYWVIIYYCTCHKQNHRNFNWR